MPEFHEHIIINIQRILLKTHLPHYRRKLLQTKETLDVISSFCTSNSTDLIIKSLANSWCVYLATERLGWQTGIQGVNNPVIN